MIEHLRDIKGKMGLKAGCQKLLAVTMLIPLAACATAAKPEAMQVMSQTSVKPFPQPLQHAMCVRAVTGGEETNPLWASKVDNKGFQAAFASSLDNAGLTASGKRLLLPC